MNRRSLLVSLAALPLAPRAALAAAPRLEVFKSPACGCCADWAEHVAAAGFDVAARDLDPDALQTLKAQAGIPPELASCHTAFVDGYVVEGHVPASDILRLLAERPEALGLAVPGMPIGSPGMEMGSRREPFDTLLLTRGGEARVFERHA